MLGGELLYVRSVRGCVVLQWGKGMDWEGCSGGGNGMPLIETSMFALFHSFGGGHYLWYMYDFLVRLSP